ncbi:MAG: pyridoxamine 5'-phosphate oxidase family protein [Candidatus Eremiobacteraeota bacterium]|nr:pyridoxamine 5'-phosphate oxidase family protein [Candidatus Eremiobacteraeota bacterium]
MLGQLNHSEMEELLRSSLVGRVGCHANGRTYVVPVAFVYEEGSIIGHSAQGLKMQMMRENPHVCFEVDAMQDLGNWRSVIAWGKFEELHGAEADRAMAALLARLLPLAATSETSHPPKDLTHQHRAQLGDLPAIVYRIRLDQMSGRFERR